MIISPETHKSNKKIKDPFAFNKSVFSGAGNVTRTRDLRITNALLYQLSYSSKILKLSYYTLKLGQYQEVLK